MIGIKNQEEFNKYMRELSYKEKCQFMIHLGINLCSDERFRCPYRGETYSLHSGKRKECNREKILKIKNLL